MQTRAHRLDVFAEKRFQGELIPFSGVWTWGVARKENACLVLSSHIPWAEKELNAMISSVG